MNHHTLVESLHDSESMRSSRWALIFLAAVVLGLGAGIALRPYLQHAPAVAALPQTATQAATLPATAGGDTLALQLRRDGKMLRVLWNRAAPMLRDANQAQLYITDGNHESKLKLSSAALRSGMLSYWPENENVAFRLEVLAEGRTISDSVQTGETIPAAPAPTVAAKPEPPERPPGATTRPPKPDRKKRQTAQRVASAVADRSADRLAEFPVSGTAPLAPPPVMATSKPALPPPITSPAPAHRSEPKVRVSGVSSVAEPQPPSRLRRAAARVPLVRRLGRLSEPVHPPKPVHRVMPVISAADRRALALPLSLNVLVEVDPSGKVAAVEPAGNGDWGSPYAVAAVSAARNWKFEPARMGDESVPGKVILRFRFEPASQ